MINLEDKVPEDHPLRAVKRRCETILRAMSRDSDGASDVANEVSSTVATATIPRRACTTSGTGTTTPPSAAGSAAT